MFTTYLGRTTFSRYEDLQEPIVGFSRDGSLAWIVVRVRVEGEHKVEGTESGDLGFTCAWITLYRREGDRWLRLGDVSSFE